MAMKFNTLVYCCIFTLLCGKWRNRLHSVNTADFHLLIPCIIKGNTFNSHKRTFLYFLFKVLKHITVCQKHLNGNTVCKIGNFKSNNKLSCLCFSLIHCHNLTFYRAFSGAFKNITKVSIWLKLKVPSIYYLRIVWTACLSDYNRLWCLLFLFFLLSLWSVISVK